MKVVILAGGLGTRLSEETAVKPKPMVEIGGKPLLWHIMQMYSAHGLNEFIVLCGYKAEVIKQYFNDFHLLDCDITLDFATGERVIHNAPSVPWRVTMVDTGNDTMTGGRLKRVAELLKDEEMFCMTYGDGLADVDISASIAFHKSHDKLATLTAVIPPPRFGGLSLDGNLVTRFDEKPLNEGGRINGGFFVLSPQVLSYIENDQTSWEQEPLSQLAQAGELMAYVHNGFWQPMDTLRDKMHLESLWNSKNPPWKVW
ncbi:glucose-1-phosphate cytidylyltransferase [Shewanella fidelis]|uniref:Glucose-1-phosphate cytidylyltransferase n=1 Tax=Shewanella fidelis TaxID=173509 RepID=A0AAW8NNN5_9GAMM|nr:glucose-1-phosphate cytidylyltransferase [Shewanella fidelis]MDR8524512.1 glucose-1-phosphate cytidylyltransferase [Shewanella fidelis]MDW4811988.1 glucose-1-phosphate cytidylyltransferase [Shewanella fidelis]MDW4817073.1 glucose-1-phosphate cytidylyltransferase [Shewanella fidelis]MDW4821143.1 glucose-1-phosphate cytidylyltransferase [Shewanella fidelis]MDW4822594.1 glucose-1-phosphate cytidylyltransferase [Shewanella fidelis]